jgi:hypothetical protein
MQQSATTCEPSTKRDSKKFNAVVHLILTIPTHIGSENKRKGSNTESHKMFIHDYLAPGSWQAYPVDSSLFTYPFADIVVGSLVEAMLLIVSFSF